MQYFTRSDKLIIVLADPGYSAVGAPFGFFVKIFKKSWNVNQGVGLCLKFFSAASEPRFCYKVVSCLKYLFPMLFNVMIHQNKVLPKHYWCLMLLHFFLIQQYLNIALVYYIHCCKTGYLGTCYPGHVTVDGSSLNSDWILNFSSALKDFQKWTW